MQKEKKGPPIVGILLALAFLTLICGGALTGGGFMAWRYFDTQKRIVMEQERAKLEEAKAEQEAAMKQAENGEQLEKARALYEEGKTEEALKILDELVLSDAKNVDVWILHGRCLSKLRDNSRALQDFGRAVMLDEKRVDALNYRAFMFFQEQLYTDALKDTDAILLLEPNNGRAYKLRSDCDFQLGNLSQAKEDAQKSCDLGYEDGCVAAKRLKRF